MKRRKRKDSHNVINMNGKDGGDGRKDGLNNENIRVYST
jgi:hypothetical protein